MRNSRFNHTLVHYHLREHLETLTLPTQSTDAIPQEQGLLINAIRRLSATISIPRSNIDETVELVLQASFGEPPTITQDGFYADISDIPVISDELYELTVMGRLEANLREYIVDTLRGHLTKIEDSIDEAQKDHNDFYERIWTEYYEALSEFEEGDLGYDYDGPIYPEEPTIMPFHRETAIANREEELSLIDLEDPAVILAEVPVQKGHLGDMLHEHFEDCEYIDDIVDALDFTALSRAHITHFLRTVDIFFPDTDILKRGFLTDILIDHIEHEFAKKRGKVDIDIYIGELFCALEKDNDSVLLLEQYNEGAKNNDDLVLQRLWFYLSELTNLLVRQIHSEKTLDTDALARNVNRRYAALRHEKESSLNALIKVFPKDSVDSLYFPAQSADNRGHYPSHDVQLHLKPIFHTLELVARETHVALTKQVAEKSSVRKTNVVSAMMSFVVSTQADHVLESSGCPSRMRFINVPLNFDYGTEIVSFDQAFSSDDDIERSISLDLENGAKIARRPVTLSEDQSIAAKQQMMRLIETLGMDHDKKEQMLSQISEAEIAKPDALGYLTTSDVTKSTEHRHSERVLNRALKKTENVKKIIDRLREGLKLVGVDMGTYTIHSGALLVYSYPNSICDPCSISFLALQNSYEKGFLASFVEQANTKEEGATVQLRTRGFNQDTMKQDPSEFGITVIAGSSSVFSKDDYAKLIVHRPEAKFTCHQMPYTFAKPGINLFSSASQGDRLFEYTAGSSLHNDDAITVPYNGRMFMSGSKQSKLSDSKISKLEADVSTVLQKANTG